MSGVASLQAADAAAAGQRGADRPAGGSSVACPLKQLRYALEVVVVGEDDNPVPSVAVELRKSENQALPGRTGPGGSVRFERLEAGSYQVALYELDAEAWELISAEALPDERARSSGDASWAAPAERESKGFTHTAKQGECIPKLAHRFGFFPETLWSHPDNGKLAALRKDRNVLNPDDKVYIPKKQFKTVNGAAGQKVTLRRKGVPETLRLRFLLDGQPRKSVPYLLTLKATGGPLPDRTGSTDDGGFIVQAVPPSVTGARITLGQGETQEVHHFDVSHLDPLDTVSGVKGRLHSLAYYDGPIDNRLDWVAISAIVCFQVDHELEPNGDPADPKFQSELQKAYLS